jgi:hypothetical protein
MIKNHLFAAASLVAVALPGAAYAQGVARGSAEGAADQRPRFRKHVVRESRPSYTYRDEVRVGAELPSSGVTYYEVPAEYGVRDYRYTVVNNRAVLVDPRTHRIVEVIE